MFSLAYPWALLGLIPLGALFYYIWRYRPLPALRVSSTKVFVQSGAAKRPKPGICFFLAWIGMTLLILALARPRLGSEQITIRAEGIDMILALDLSGSMQLIDIPEEITSEKALSRAIESGELTNRLEVAKVALSNFIDKRPNDRIGLIGFAELPYTIAPPTLDHKFLQGQFQQLTPGVIGDNTGIAGPLASGIKRLEDSQASRRVLVLFTDGANNVDNRITPEQAAALAGENDVVIYTVGIGGNRSVVIQTDPFGRQILMPTGEATFDEASLKKIAQVGNGKYFRANDAEAFQQVMDEINSLEKTVFEQPSYMEYKEFGPALIVLGGVCLLLGYLLEHTIKLSLP